MNDIIIKLGALTSGINSFSFDIKDQFGSNIFDDRGRLSLENYEYSIEPHTYIAVLIEMQEQIDNLKKTVEQLKHKSDWVSGYDDHGWNTK